MENNFCAIVFIGTGSSWAWGSDKIKTAKRAAKVCKSDWKGIYQFKPKHEFKVCVYDMANHEGWYASHDGVFDQDTNEKIPLLEVVNVVA